MLDQSTVKNLLNYNPKTGVFTWKKARSNNVEAGSVAGSVRSDGYVRISIKNKPYLAHRIAWLYQFGVLPQGQIDHENGNRSDNRITNLRDCSNQTNQRNQRRAANNTSGVTGVSWHKKEQRWRARISTDGKQVHLGCFKEKSDAIAARKAAEKEHGYHPNHGRA